MKTIRLAIISSHPIQYYTPLFRVLPNRLELKVFYTHLATSSDQAQADMPSVIGDDRQRGEPPPLSGYGKARRKLSGFYEHVRRRLFFYLGW